MDMVSFYLSFDITRMHFLQHAMVIICHDNHFKNYFGFGLLLFALFGYKYDIAYLKYVVFLWNHSTQSQTCA